MEFGIISDWQNNLVVEQEGVKYYQLKAHEGPGWGRLASAIEVKVV